MIKKTRTVQGQTALILILLTAAALIFLAITLNWGRIAQVKCQVSIAADQAAALLASDVASYGEMQKQSYLQNSNILSEMGGYIMAIVMLIIAIIITIASYGSGSYMLVVAIIAIAAAVATLVLQITVVQPGITSMWNKLQQNQPIVEQFLEGGIGAALQGAVSDQVNITDYFDSNGNGLFGKNVAGAFGASNDTVGRYAVFYTERMRMFNQALPPIPQVVFFYNQLGEFVNGETCGENEQDNKLYPSIPLNLACQDAGVGTTIDCSKTPGNPVCQMKVPNGFQLSDACPSNSDYNNLLTYNPYCDPCCQPVSVPNPGGKPDPILVRPGSCKSDAQCSNNNPFGATYLDIYDPTYQNYSDNVSFLAQFGRDQQKPTFSTTLSPEQQGALAKDEYFPNGIYPFFWKLKYYSPQVDTISSIDSATPQPVITPAVQHWCTSDAAPGYLAPAGFPDLAQLKLNYAAQNKDRCVNFLPDGFGGASSTTLSLSFSVGPAAAAWQIEASKNSSALAVTSTIGLLAGADTINLGANDSEAGAVTITYTMGGSGNTYTSSIAPNYEVSEAKALDPGVYSVTAQAVDSSNVKTNASNTLTVVAMSVSGISPTSGTVGSPMTLSATASAGTGNNITVQIKNGATILPGTVTGSGGTYTLTWTPTSAGTVTITVVATYGGVSVTGPTTTVTIAPAPATDTGTDTSTDTSTS